MQQPQAEQLSTRTDPSITELLHQQQSIQRDRKTFLFSKFLHSQSHYQNDHF